MLNLFSDMIYDRIKSDCKKVFHFLFSVIHFILIVVLVFYISEKIENRIDVLAEKRAAWNGSITDYYITETEIRPPPEIEYIETPCQKRRPKNRRKHDRKR